MLLFGGIETTEGMIANAVLELLRRPELLQRVNDGDPALLDAVIDESLRLEPAAAVIDRYATADATLGGAAIARGDLRADLDRRRPTATRRCSTARTSSTPAAPTSAAIWRSPRGRMSASACTWRASRRAPRCGRCSTGLPGLRADPERPAEVRGLVFRKPVALHARWDV